MRLLRIITLTFSISLVLAGCGPSQVELDTHATEKAATLTAGAPTATLTDTPTLTPTATITPTPTPMVTSLRGLEIKSDGEINVGIGNGALYPEFFPMFFRDGDQSAGFEIDLAEEIVMRLFEGQVDINWIPLAIQNRLEVVQNDNVDVLIFLLTHTPDRETFVLFTSNYFLHDLNDPLGIAVSRSDHAFRDEIDATLLTLIADGTWQTIYDQWFEDSPTWTIEEMLLAPPWEGTP